MLIWEIWKNNKQKLPYKWKNVGFFCLKQICLAITRLLLQSYEIQVVLYLWGITDKWPVTKVDDSPNSITLHTRNFLNFLIFEQRIVECLHVINLPSRNIVVFPIILKLCWVTAHLYPGIMDIATSSETKPTIFRRFSESKCSVQFVLKVLSKCIKLPCLWISVSPGKNG